MKRRVLISALVAYLILRWALLLHPGYVYDMNAYKRWALRAAQSGIAQIYNTSDMDYPPLYAWILYPLGKIAQAIDPAGAEAMQDAPHLVVLVKIPPLLFDFGLGWLLWRLGRHAVRRRARGAGGPDWEWILPASYLLNPGVLFDTAYWGQPDSIHSFFVLAAFLLLGVPEAFRRERPGAAGSMAAGPVAATSPASPAATTAPAAPAWPAWVALALGTLMKPLGAPFFPLLLVLSLWWRGLRSTLIGIGAAAATTLVVFLPFILSGQLGTVLRRVVGDVQLLPNTSSNAHNLWWIYGPWKPAATPVLGPITLTQIGLLVFGVLFVLLLRRVWLLHGRHVRPTGAQGGLLALGIALAFFHCSTHLHENHMFLAVPLSLALLPLAPPTTRAFRRLAVGLSLGFFLNLVTHDLVLPNRFPMTLGGPTGVTNPHLQRPFYGGELTLIWISTLLNVAIFGWFLWRTLGTGRRSWFELLGTGKPRP
jgi:hypothetical protein